MQHNFSAMYCVPAVHAIASLMHLARHLHPKPWLIVAVSPRRRALRAAPRGCVPVADRQQCVTLTPAAVAQRHRVATAGGALRGTSAT